MQFELTLEWTFIRAYPEKEVDFAPYRELSNQFDHRQDQLPKTVICPCNLGGEPIPLHLTVYSTMPWAHIKFEIADETVGNEIRQNLLTYSTENKSGTVYKGWNTRQITNQILARHGLTMKGIQRRNGVMSRSCIEELMRHYDSTEPMPRRDICWLFTRDAVPKSEQPMVARWLVSRLAQTKGASNGSHIVEQLYSEMVVPQIADELVRLITDRNFSGRDGCLFDLFLRTKDSRVLEVAISVLDDEKLTQRALATIGRRKAKQHIDRVRKFLKHPDAAIRREATRTMKALGSSIKTAPPPAHLVKRNSIPKNLEEWSANLDAVEVTPILKKLAIFIDSGFGKKEIAEVNGVMEEMKEEQTKAFRFPITAKGKKTELWLVIFMDDVDSPDLEIHSSLELIQKLNEVLKS
jgi:hypothetical protein